MEYKEYTIFLNGDKKDNAELEERAKRLESESQYVRIIHGGVHALYIRNSGKPFGNMTQVYGYQRVIEILDENIEKIDSEASAINN